MAAVECRIDEIKSEFMQMFGLQVGVIIYNKTILKESPTLPELTNCANIVLKTMVDNYPEGGIKNKSREREIIACRHIFNFFALNYGYTSTAVGRHLGVDHATVLASSFRVKSLIDSKDQINSDTMAAVQSEINKLLIDKISKQNRDAA